MKPMSTNVPRKVLVVRLGAIGDVVNALVFATALKDAAPETSIGWAVHQLAEPLVEGHSALDRVHVWPRARGLDGFFHVLKEIRRQSYDLAVDLQRITKSSLLARLSGAPRVLGFDRKRAKELSWIWTREQIPEGDSGAHMVDQYLEFARYLGTPEPMPRHDLFSFPSAEKWAQELVSQMGAAPIIIHLGATKPANWWLPERIAELAGACRDELGSPVCLTGGDKDRGIAQAAIEALQKSSPKPGLYDLIGCTDLKQLIAICARARLWIGCDTGPMHIAAACGTPVVALFGPSDPRRTGPFRKDGRIVRVPLPCSPCNQRHCHQPRHACMEDITVGMVLRAAHATVST